MPLEVSEGAFVLFQYGPDRLDHFEVHLDDRGRLYVRTPSASVAVRSIVTNHISIEAVERS